MAVPPCSANAGEVHDGFRLAAGDARASAAGLDIL
jgi:hypothetical protein